MKQLTFATCLLILGQLAGCAGMRLIDSSVMSVVDTPADYVWAGATYRFERLPSQKDQPGAAIAERQAEQALSAAGLKRIDAPPGAGTATEPRLSVLVGFQGFQYLPTGVMGRTYWGDVDFYGGVGRGTPWGSGWGLGMGLNLPPPPRYRREVSLIIRDLASGRLVYETRATYDGPWSDNEPVFAALFRAALADFPKPPEGIRRVDIEIPR
jgi:hypothetical protein